MRSKQSLYLAAGASNNALKQEHDLRQRAGLPGTFLDAAQLAEAFEISRAGGIVSPGSADADPVRLANAMLNVAVARGARLIEAEAVDFDAAGRSIGVQLADGRMIEARHTILATGYVMPDIVKATVQSPSSSWAIATKPQPANIWRDAALIWEDSKDYLYARTTDDGRIIIGGEDSASVIDGDARDALIPQKSAALTRKLAALWPRAELDIDYRWSGTFDTTKDGLPLIGEVPGAKGMLAAYGYGGNGITFSQIASEIVSASIKGLDDADAPLFAFNP
jgi:glycine/D-amino acid oxidase-like deaminating enzyme